MTDSNEIDLSLIFDNSEDSFDTPEFSFEGKHEEAPQESVSLPDISYEKEPEPVKKTVPVKKTAPAKKKTVAPPFKRAGDKAVPVEKEVIINDGEERPDEERLLRKTTFKEDGKPEFYATDIDVLHLDKYADKYLADIPTEVPPLLSLARKWSRYTQLKQMVREGVELTPDEKAEGKKLQEMNKRGEFQPLFDL